MSADTFISQSRSLSLTGNVTDEDFALVKGTVVSGKVVDGSGAPIAGASVSGYASGGSGSDSTSTAPDGTYTLDSLPTGGVNISVYADAYISQSRSLNLTGDVTGVDFTLVDGTSVSGKVVDGSGAPIAGASVNASSGSSYDSTSTAPDGTFVLDSLALGTANLSVSANGFAPQSRAVNLTGDLTGVDFVLVKGTVVSGKVVDGAGSPIAGASVNGYSSSGGGGSDSTSTAADGTYTLDSLSPGTVNISASANGFVSQTRSLELIQRHPGFQLRAGLWHRGVGAGD